MPDGENGATGTETEWIGETFTSSVGWDHLERLVDVGNRMAGSDGERRAAEATRDALESVGASDVRIEEFPIQGWRRGASAVEADGERHDCIGLPRSPAEEATGEFVDLGYGLPADFGAGEGEADLDGRVVMVASDVPDHFDRFVHRREKYYRAVDAGAAAFVFRNHVPGNLAPTGSVGTAERPIGEIPAVGVSKEVGARLARRYEGEPLTVAVNAEIGEATSRTVSATVGPDTREAVFVTAHLDAHDIAEGALDNGAGTAVCVEIARALLSREDDLDTGVRVVVFGAEEVGLVGSERDAERIDPERIEAVVNNDGVVRGRTLSAFTHGFPELEAAAERVADRFDHPIETIPRQSPHSDHWPFVVRGIPAYHVTSETDDRGRGWGHTAADTLDKLEPRNLTESAILLTDLVVEVASADVEIAHRDPEGIAAALEREDQAEGMKLTGDWPFPESVGVAGDDRSGR